MSDQKKKEPVVITLAKLKELVDAGKTKEEIGKEFNLSASATTKLIKEANNTLQAASLPILKPKRKVVPAFLLIKVDIGDLHVNTTKPNKSSDEDMISVPTKGAEDLPETSEDSKDW
jgi:hypothetical protein